MIQWRLENSWHDRRTLGRRRWTRILIGIIILGSVINGTVTWRTHKQARNERERIEEAVRQREQRARQERQEIAQGVADLVQLAREQDPSLTEQEALKRIGSEVQTLREKTSNLEHELQGFRRFNNVAHLNALGLTDKLKAGSGISMTSGLSLALEGAYEKTEDGTVSPQCNNEGIAAFEKAITINPDFPFAYWALAICAFKAGKRDWREYAERAVEILQQTTQISGHNRGHDQALQYIDRLVAGEAYLRKDYAAALAGFQPLAELGDPAAQFILGRMYDFGQGVHENDAEAIRWYRRAAEQGNVKAQGRLERMHAQEERVPEHMR